jgi:hypothetical protein
VSSLPQAPSGPLPAAKAAAAAARAAANASRDERPGWQHRHPTFDKPNLFNADQKMTNTAHIPAWEHALRAQPAAVHSNLVKHRKPADQLSHSHPPENMQLLHSLLLKVKKLHVFPAIRGN